MSLRNTVALAFVFAMIAGTGLALVWPREQPRMATSPSYANPAYDPR